MSERHTPGGAWCPPDCSHRATMPDLRDGAKSGPTGAPAGDGQPPTDTLLRRAWWIGELSRGRDPFEMEATVMAARLPSFRGQDPEEVLAGERGLVAELRARLAAPPEPSPSPAPATGGKLIASPGPPGTVDTGGGARAEAGMAGNDYRRGYEAGWADRGLGHDKCWTVAHDATIRREARDAALGEAERALRALAKRIGRGLSMHELDSVTAGREAGVLEAADAIRALRTHDTKERP